MIEKVPHSNQASVKANGLEITFDTFGDADSAPMLLISGLGGQMISWDDPLCRLLASRGYRVIRFDNRDAGLSTKLEGAEVPDPLVLFETLSQKKRIRAPYTLDDMAQDAFGLLDALGIVAAHVLGMSLGGMIAQTMAIRKPERVRTLISIMSTTSDPNLPPPRPEALKMLLAPAPRSREAYLEHAVEWRKVLSGPGFSDDEERIRTRAARMFDRGLHPEGKARQMAAVLASGSRKEALRAVSLPTLVIHGDADPLVPVECGIDTADAIEGAKLMIVRGLGHALPPAVWPQLVEAIANHAR